MNAVDVECPICDTLNKSLNLAETDGWMECECCGNVVQIMKYASVDVKNSKTVLPQTGGNGNIIAYSIAFILLAAGGTVFFISRRKKKSSNKAA